ncbi:MAG: addiction module protein [Planctomycetia bacterium]|nr:addiction module protein [Planctomycetia bacterium]
MSSPLDEIRDAALELPETQRIELIDSLISSLPPDEAIPLDDAWLAEIDRRSKEYDEGRVPTSPWSAVKERARRRLGLDA